MRETEIGRKKQGNRERERERETKSEYVELKVSRVKKPKSLVHLLHCHAFGGHAHFCLHTPPYPNVDLSPSTSTTVIAHVLFVWM